MLPMTPALARGRALDEAWVMINFKSCNWRKAEVGFTTVMNSKTRTIDLTHDTCHRKGARWMMGDSFSSASVRLPSENQHYLIKKEKDARGARLGQRARLTRPPNTPRARFPRGQVTPRMRGHDAIHHRAPKGKSTPSHNERKRCARSALGLARTFDAHTRWGSNPRPKARKHR